jgi:hypothetical protein
LSRTAILVAVFLFSCNQRHPTSNYTPQPYEDSEALDQVIRAEYVANHWPDNNQVCLTLQGQNPSETVIRDLRKRNLKVISAEEFQRHFNCGFELQLEILAPASPQSTNVHSTVLDLRDIQSGSAHIATLSREGTFSLKKSGSSLSIASYEPKALSH